MKKESNLFTSAMLYTIGSFLLKGINFFTIPIFTRLLNTANYGITSIYTTWSGLFAIFVGLGINGTIGSAKANLDENEYKEYLSSNMFLSTVVFLIILILISIFKKKLSIVVGLSSSLCILLVIQSFFSFVISFISSVYTFDKEPIKYLKLSFITTLLNIIVSILLILSLDSNRYLGKIYGSASVTIVMGIILYFNIIFKGKKLISKKHWGYCLPIAIPIIFHNISHLVLNQADRVMLQQWTNDSIVGIYSFTYNIGIMLNIIHMSINSAWVAWYFDSLKDKIYEEIEDKAKWYIIIFTVITGMFLLGSPEVIKILSPKEYWEGIKLLPLIILGYYFVFLYTFGVNYEFFKKKTSFIAAGTIVAALINIGVNFILIPKIGVSGAAISTLVAYFILFVMHEFIVRIIMKHKDFPFYYYIYSLILVVITTSITYLLLDRLIVRWLIIILSFMLISIIAIKIFKRNKK